MTVTGHWNSELLITFSCKNCQIGFGSLESDDSNPLPAYSVWTGCHGNRGRRTLAEHRDGSVEQQDVISTLGKQSECTLTPNRTAVSLIMISCLLPTWILSYKRADGKRPDRCSLLSGRWQQWQRWCGILGGFSKQREGVVLKRRV